MENNDYVYMHIITCLHAHYYSIIIQIIIQIFWLRYNFSKPNEERQR